MFKWFEEAFKIKLDIKKLLLTYKLYKTKSNMIYITLKNSVPEKYMDHLLSINLLCIVVIFK